MNKLNVANLKYPFIDHEENLNEIRILIKGQRVIFSNTLSCLVESFLGYYFIISRLVNAIHYN